MRKNLLSGILVAGLFSLGVNAQTNTFPTSGNVGIGITTTTSKLSVVTNDYRVADFTNTAGTTASISLKSTNSNWLLGSVGGAGDALQREPGAFTLERVGSNTFLNVLTNGNVGIGVLKPIEKLEVGGPIKVGTAMFTGDGFNSFYGNNASTSGTRYVEGYANGWLMNCDKNGNGDVSIRMAGTGIAGSAITWNYPFTIKNNGNVIVPGKLIVGASALSSFPCANNLALNVNGTIGATEVRVSTTTWCDYVFNKDYKLKSLKEVDAYIQANKHLPEVPSEKEVVENGVAMGEMMKIHMKKIEELTLYMIELQKQNEKLAAEVAQLKK